MEGLTPLQNYSQIGPSKISTLETHIHLQMEMFIQVHLHLDGFFLEFYFEEELSHNWSLIVNFIQRTDVNHGKINFNLT